MSSSARAIFLVETLLRFAEELVDTPLCTVVLRAMWLIVGLPCAVLSLYGLAIGISEVLTRWEYTNLSGVAAFWALGASGLAGILGAAVRLSNEAGELARLQRRRRTAKIGLSLGVLASIAPVIVAIQTFDTLFLRAYSIAFFIPFLLGTLLWLGTIGIRVQGDA